MFRLAALIIGLFLAAGAVQAAEPGTELALALNSDCEDNCAAQQNTCMEGCSGIKDTDRQNSCVRGCLKGGTACAKRCRGGESLNYTPVTWSDEGGPTTEAYLVQCAQLPVS